MENNNSNIVEGPRIKKIIQDKTLGQFFFNGARRYQDNIYSIDASLDKSESFASTNLKSIRLALNLLHKKSIKPSDIILICSKNRLDNAIPILSASYLGCKFASLDPTLSLRQTNHLISLVEPKLIFTDHDSLGLIKSSLDQICYQDRTEVVVFGSEGFDGYVMEFVEGEDVFRPVDVDEDEVALIFFSSGTTGMPKAICHSHKTFLHIINSTHALMAGYKEASLHFTTLYWISGLLAACYPFVNGSYRIFDSDSSPENVFRIIERYKVTSIFLAPIYTNKLTSFKNAQNYDTSSLKSFLTGGTSLSADQYRRLKHLFKHANIIYGYGMTECGIVSLFDPANMTLELFQKKVGSTGNILAGCSLKIVNPDTGKSCDYHESGEIRVKSPGLLLGYYNSNSKKLNRDGIFDEDGYLRTGDIGYFDSDDFLYIKDRIKEMFKYRSWHIVPSAIEAVLLEHPAIAEAVVFGVFQGDEEGDAPAACVVLHEGVEAAEEEIERFVAERVADVEKLRGGVMIVGEIAKTPSGKVVRREMKKIFEDSSKCIRM